jgi:hypothetical protein
VLKVVLFLPPYDGKLLGPPLGLLSLAASVREAGYEPVIIDGALEPAPHAGRLMVTVAVLALGCGSSAPSSAWPS